MINTSFLLLIKSFFFVAKFYTFNTASGHQISLTGFHLIPIVYLTNETINYIPAKDIKLGDRFYVLINQQFQSSPVTNITIEIKHGYFAPLTMTGKRLTLFFFSLIILFSIQLRNNIS